MSIIKDSSDADKSTVQIFADWGGVYIGVNDGFNSINHSLVVDHADLIEVIEKEIGGIFIKDADLPEISTEREGVARVNGSNFELTEVPDDLEKIAKTYLAAARHIRANQPPPIDQEQVKAFEDALTNIDEDVAHKDGLGVALVKAGYKITKEV